MPQMVAIWPQQVPDAQCEKGPAVVDEATGHYIHISNPTLQHFAPPAGVERRTCAVVVCPGGGYRKLAYQHEGVDIARWLAEQGYEAYVLAYRLPHQRLGALQDVMRAIRLVQHWGHERVGLMGFSAGAHLCCQAAMRWQQTLYAPQDEADRLAQRPHFAALVYPAYLADGLGGALSGELTVGPHVPPIFAFGTQDDHYSGPSVPALLQAMQREGAPIECHYLERGGHGYGMQARGAGPVWPPLALAWLAGQ